MIFTVSEWKQTIFKVRKWEPTILSEHEEEWTIFTVSEWDQTIFSGHEQEWMIFTVSEWEQTIFTGHAQEWMILKVRKWEPTILSVHEQEWTIFTLSEWEKTIFFYTNKSEPYLQWVNESEQYFQCMSKSERYLKYANESKQYLQCANESKWDCDIHIFQDFKRNDWEMANNQWEWAGKYHLWLLMTNIIHFLPFMNSWEQYFLKQSDPANFSSCTILFRPILSNGNLAHACYLPFPRFSTFRSLIWATKRVPFWPGAHILIHRDKLECLQLSPIYEGGTRSIP